MLKLFFTAVLIAVLFLPLEAAKKKNKNTPKKKTGDVEAVKEYLKGPSSEITKEGKLEGRGKVFSLFEQAAKEFQIPIDVLLAAAYHESSFHMRRPKSGQSGGWGYMGLGGPNSPASLKKGAKLLNLEEEKVKTDPLANVRAGAAYLNECRFKTLGKKRASKARMKDYHKILKTYASTGDEFMDQLFADEIFTTLSKGHSQRMEDGELITIAAQPELSNFEPEPLKF